MACEPRLGLRVLAADVAREPGLVYDAVDVTRPPPARFSWRALYAAPAAAAAAADERSGAGRALEPGDFSFEREIGVGAFGQVVLATHKKTGTRYAVKTISKKVLRRKKIAQRIWRLERDVLVRIEPHPYIVPLLGSFQTLSHFFLVLIHLDPGPPHIPKSGVTGVFPPRTIQIDLAGWVELQVLKDTWGPGPLCPAGPTGVGPSP